MHTQDDIMVPMTFIFTLLLWLLVRWGRIDQWPPRWGAVVSWTVLGGALYCQFLWLASVIEGWQALDSLIEGGGPPQVENQWLRPLVAAVSAALSAGRQLGWLVVGATALFCLLHSWRLALPGTRLIRVAAWISTFACIGVYTQLFGLFLIVFMVFVSQPPSILVSISLMKLTLCLLLLGLLGNILARGQRPNKFELLSAMHRTIT